MACLLSHLGIQVQRLLANVKKKFQTKDTCLPYGTSSRVPERKRFIQPEPKESTETIPRVVGAEQAVMFHGVICYHCRSMCLLPFLKSCSYLKMPKVINLQRRKVYFGSQFGKFQSMLD